MRQLSMIVLYCSPAIMNRRFVAATIVALAVLFSQGGGLVLAAICPHLRSQQNVCHGALQQVVTGYHEVAETKADAFETDESDAACNHCAVHSRTKREDTALQQASTSQRASDSATSTPPSVVGPPSLSKTVKWVAKAHGPPGANGPLHLLLNVFRI
jgi:hypothetical protein